MEILLNPKYSKLHPALEHIEELFAEGEVVQQAFNEIRTVKVDGLELSIKKYGQKRVRKLKFYKMAKGKKAYIGQRLLRERGYDSPEPVAFVRFRRHMLTSRTYFVTVKSPLRYTLTDLSRFPAQEQHDIIRAFAAYVARLHSDGFLHRNFKSKHILFDIKDGAYRFSLIDVNRVHKGRVVSVEKGLHSMGRLTGDDAFFKELSACYAEARGVNADDCYRMVIEAHDAYADKVSRRGH